MGCLQRNADEVLAVQLKVTGILVICIRNLDPHRPMATVGIDSMVAVGARNWFAKEVQADVAIFDIMGNKELQEVAAIAAQRSRLRLKSAVTKQAV
ncbi:hypothetical protein VTN77DRAFT_457 [Rasamsonia byssochlamydoides]|uniref:uncharacterized protein n=1 Tax=Rasamsonia byssochlamydoides TaxID=89139 RepID=UPI0037432C16